MFTIYHTLTVNTDIETVFDGVTLPKHLINWWPLQCKGVPKLGEVYNFNFTDTYDWYGKVSDIKPFTTFAIRMTDSDDDWDPTTFGFQLEKVDDTKTKIHFYHEGWQHQNEHFKISSFCWAILLKGLKEYLEQGIIIPFENRS